MRNNLKNVQYLLFVLFIFAMTGCGASNLASTSSNEPGSITAKVVFNDGKSTAKSVGLVPAGVTSIRFKITGPYQIPGDTTSASRYTTTKATFPAAAGGGTVSVAPGKGLIVAVQALNESDILLYEGFVRNVEVISGTPKDLGVVALTAPYVKSAETPCLGCHEDSRAASGNNIVAEYKGSRHYTRTVSPLQNFSSTVYNGYYADSVGCAGCHTQKHKDLNPAASGRCYACHTSAGNPPNFPHATAGFVELKIKCNDCHNPHTTELLTPNTNLARCVDCHSIKQNKGVNYVQDNDGVRAITGEFAKWSHHVTGVAVNDAHCIACHLEGTVVNGKTVIDSTKHMANATTHLRNADTDADIVWDPAKPSFSNMDNFCLSCHDANGATSPVSVQIQAFINTNKLAAAGKTASASNPFGDTISNQYDLLQRPAVVDADSQFATTNPSHHAVKGKRYTGRTRTGTDRAVASTFASNSSAALPGARSTIYDAGKFQSDYTTLADAAGETGTRNGGTSLGDDSTLHCGDCHTVGQFRAADAAAGNRYNKVVIGAHGANNEYLLRNNIGTDERHQGAETTGGTSGVPTVGYGTKPYLVCFNCHAFATYGSVGSSTSLAGLNHAGEYANSTRCNGPYNTVFGNMTGEARLESMTTRTDATGATGYGKFQGSTFGNIFGIQCNNCHNSGITAGNLFGGIHGSKDATYTDGMGNTSKHYRFMPGLGNVLYVPGTKGGFTGGTLAAYISYSGNRNGTSPTIPAASIPKISTAVNCGFNGTSLCNAAGVQGSIDKWNYTNYKVTGQTFTALPFRTKVQGMSPVAGTMINGVTVPSQVLPYLNVLSTTVTPSGLDAIPVVTKVPFATGSYQYTTGGISNDLNWEQKSQQPVAGEYDYQAKSMGCYTLTAATGPSVTTTGSLQPNGTTSQAAAAYDITADLPGPNGTKKMFDNWGGCDDHDGKQGAGTAPFRKVLRKVTY